MNVNYSCPECGLYSVCATNKSLVEDWTCPYCKLTLVENNNEKEKEEGSKERET